MIKITDIREKAKSYSAKYYRNLYEYSEEKLYIFLSIDICGSTILKANKENRWFEINRILYNYDFNRMNFWKLNGDEVLYYEEFNNISHLIEIIKEAYKHIKNMESAINSKENNFTNEIVGLKGTLWIARTDKSDSKDFDSIRLKNEIITEYIGLSVDEGFRLTQKASKSKLVIDPKIVHLLNQSYLVSENPDLNSSLKKMACKVSSKDYIDIFTNIRFVGYTKLKGIWKDRGYPVFWYFENKDTDYEYDEHLDQMYVGDKIKRCYSFSDEKVNIHMDLNKIFENVSLSNEIKKILAIASKSKPHKSIDSFARLYYSCVCVNTHTNHVLIAKRSEKRHHLKNVWEFGISKHTSTPISIAEVIKNDYKNEFGIDIEVVTDGEKENNIIPMHFCTIYRKGTKHNNILCFAKIVGGEYKDEDLIKIIRKNTDKKRYIDFKFVGKNDTQKFETISIEDIEKDSIMATNNKSKAFGENRAVMYFAQSVSAAINYFQDARKEKKWYE